MSKELACIFMIVVSLAGGIGMALTTNSDLKTGLATKQGTIARRESEPARYWTFVFLKGFMACSFLASGIFFSVLLIRGKI